jgi:tetratricopeptide (TPR) repeat protein
MEALECVRAATKKYKFVVTYGCSMGGYAALNFSSHLNAHRALAIYPQLSINRSVVPFETRWQEEAKLIDFSRDSIHIPPNPGARDIVLFDPHITLDKLQAEAIHKVRGSELVPLPFLGHGGMGAGVDTEMLKKIIRLIVEENDKHISSVAKRMHKTFRRTKAKYYFELARRRPSMNPAMRVDLLLRASSRAVDDYGINFDLAKCLVSLERLHEAYYVLMNILSRRDSDAGLCSYIAFVLIKMRNYREALQLSQRAVASDPSNAYLWHQNAYIRLQYGDNAGAQNSQKTAARLSPDKYAPHI